MGRRVCLLLFLILSFCAIVPLEQGAAQGNPVTSARLLAAACDNIFRSASGTTQVTVCPAVVESGHDLQFTIQASPNQQVTAVLLYPDGTNESKTSMTDAQGAATIDMAVRYNPLGRYGQAKFTVTVGQAGATDGDVVTGTVNIAQSAAAGVPVLRVKPAGARTWCSDTGRCVVRDHTTVQIRVDTDPNAQVQLVLSYPNGVTLSCPGNDLPGGSGAFADSSGAFECQMPVYYSLPNARATAIVLVQATVVTSSDTIPVQYKLWLKK